MNALSGINDLDLSVHRPGRVAAANETIPNDGLIDKPSEDFDLKWHTLIYRQRKSVQTAPEAVGSVLDCMVNEHTNQLQTCPRLADDATQF
jgi:hypothetical protein